MGSLESCRQHGLDHELLDASAIASRFPAFHLPEDFAGVLQPDGGYLLAERSVVAFVDGARRRGAEVRSGEAVRELAGRAATRSRSAPTAASIAPRRWRSPPAPGRPSWCREIADLARPERQVVGWFRPRRPELFEAERFPVFDILFEEGNYYGLPASGQPGLKIGRHGHLHEPADPDHVDRAIHPRDEAVLRRALARYFPDGDGDAVALTTCLFTNSPDQHFIVDLVHDAPRVVVAAGFSGHGFKFAPVMGEIVADLATTGSSRHSIERFLLRRFDRSSPMAAEASGRRRPGSNAARSTSGGSPSMACVNARAPLGASVMPSIP